MRIQTKAFVLSNIRYGDTSLIVKCYTETSGLKTYLIKGALSPKNKKFSPSFFLPLTFLEVEAVHKNKGTLESITEVKIAAPYHSIHSEIEKSTIAVFLSEILSMCLKEEEANPDLFHFLENAFNFFEHQNTCTNFHLFLLVHLSRYLGFSPDLSGKGDFFDLNEGILTATQSNLCMNEAASNLLKLLEQSDLENLSNLKISAHLRQDFLNLILNYYEIHFDGFKKPRSLAVLKQIFTR